MNNESRTIARIGDLWGVVPAINGKIELVYEGEQEGAAMVAQHLIGKALRSYFLLFFPDPSKLKKKKTPSPYQTVLDWFSSNDALDLMLNADEFQYRQSLDSVDGLAQLVETYMPKLDKKDKHTAMEFVLHALAEHSQIGKSMRPMSWKERRIDDLEISRSSALNSSLSNSLEILVRSRFALLFHKCNIYIVFYEKEGTNPDT
jgi:hypothetical protein